MTTIIVGQEISDCSDCVDRVRNCLSNEMNVHDLEKDEVLLWSYEYKLKLNRHNNSSNEVLDNIEIYSDNNRTYFSGINVQVYQNANVNVAIDHKSRSVLIANTLPSEFKTYDSEIHKRNQDSLLTHVQKSFVSVMEIDGELFDEITLIIDDYAKVKYHTKELKYVLDSNDEMVSALSLFVNNWQYESIAMNKIKKEIVSSFPESVGDDPTDLIYDSNGNIRSRLLEYEVENLLSSRITE